MKYGPNTLRGDIFGGVTSMVVALPVSLGFGIASGMGAAAGLYGAIAVGFFASVFGGTRSQISGPTAPMTVAMAVVLTSYADSLGEALTVVVMAGLLQVLLGISRIGRFVAYTPHVVVSGFMSGIGIIIILMQSLPLLGASGATSGPMSAARALPMAAGDVHVGAFAVGAITWPWDSSGRGGSPVSRRARSWRSPPEHFWASVVRRRTRDRRDSDRPPDPAVRHAVGRVSPSCLKTGDHPCPAGFGRQPVDLPGSGLDDRQPPQPEPGN